MSDIPASCIRHAFGGCAGDGGPTCRNCPGRAEEALSAPPPVAGRDWLENTLIAVIILCAVAGGYVGHGAFAREAAAHMAAIN